MKLVDCAEVKTGLVLSRKSLKPSESRLEEGKEIILYPHLTLKSFSVKGVIVKEDLGELEVTKELEPRYLTKEGDIVMRMSVPYTAILITKEDVGLVITSNFVRICPTTPDVSPNFLCWALNAEETKKKIKIATSSIMLGSVSPQVLSNLEITLLPMDKQEKIGILHHLFQREQQLLTLLQEKKEVYQAAALKQIYKSIEGESL